MACTRQSPRNDYALNQSPKGSLQYDTLLLNQSRIRIEIKAFKIKLGINVKQCTGGGFVKEANTAIELIQSNVDNNHLGDVICLECF